MLIEVGDDIHLTEFRASDLSALVELLSVREIYDNTLRIPWPYTVAEAEAWLQITHKPPRAGWLDRNWAIRNAGAALLGGIGLIGYPSSPHRAEIGYWLGRPFWGRGIMPRVVESVCDHAFTVLSLQKITANVFAGNLASARVLEKSGFQEEGFLRKHHYKDGVFIDARVFGRLKILTEPNAPTVEL